MVQIDGVSYGAFIVPEPDHAVALDAWPTASFGIYMPHQAPSAEIHSAPFRTWRSSWLRQGGNQQVHHPEICHAGAAAPVRAVQIASIRDAETPADRHHPSACSASSSASGTDGFEAADRPADHHAADLPGMAPFIPSDAAAVLAGRDLFNPSGLPGQLWLSLGDSTAWPTSARHQRFAMYWVFTAVCLILVRWIFRRPYRLNLSVPPPSRRLPWRGPAACDLQFQRANLYRNQYHVTSLSASTTAAPAIWRSSSGHTIAVPLRSGQRSSGPKRFPAVWRSSR